MDRGSQGERSVQFWRNNDSRCTSVVAREQRFARASVFHGASSRLMTAPTRRWAMMACAAMVLAPGCIRTSLNPEYVVMHKLNGDAVSLFYAGGLGLDGELLAVTDSSFIVMGSAGVTVVPRHSVRRIEF